MSRLRTWSVEQCLMKGGDGEGRISAGRVLKTDPVKQTAGRLGTEPVIRYATGRMTKSQNSEVSSGRFHRVPRDDPAGTEARSGVVVALRGDELMMTRSLCESAAIIFTMINNREQTSVSAFVL